MATHTILADRSRLGRHTNLASYVTVSRREKSRAPDREIRSSVRRVPMPEATSRWVLRIIGSARSGACGHSFLIETAFLVFLAAPARAGVIAPDFLSAAAFAR